MRTTIIASLAAFVLGCLAHHLVVRSKYAGSESQLEQLTADLESKKNELHLQRSTYERLKADLGKFAGIDLEEIKKIKDAEERAERLSALVGELFMVLLNHAILSDGVREPQKSSAGSVGPNSKEAGNAPHLTTVKSSEPPGAEPDSPENAPSAGSEPPRGGAPSPWTAAEGDLPKLTLANAESFLAKVAIPDLKAELKNARPHQADDPRIEAIQGSFAGPIEFLDKKRKPQTMELDVNGRDIVKGNVTGSYELRIFKDGQRIGRTAGSGDLAIKNPAGQSQALIIKASPDQFFQVYALADGQSLVGNFYEVEELGEPKLVGRVRLQRN